jgi:hypothetical protein
MDGEMVKMEQIFMDSLVYPGGTEMILTENIVLLIVLEFGGLPLNMQIIPQVLMILAYILIPFQRILAIHITIRGMVIL